MSATTLEEVFLRVADGSNGVVEDRNNMNHVSESVRRQSSLSSTSTTVDIAQARTWEWLFSGYVVFRSDWYEIPIFIMWLPLRFVST